MSQANLKREQKAMEDKRNKAKEKLDLNKEYRDYLRELLVET